MTAAPDSPSGSGDDDVWTVLRMMRWSGEYLDEKGVERGRLDAEHLLAHALELERLQLYLQYDRPLTREELDRYRPLLKRRARREPLQYILGRAAFRELELKVDSRVLIPRPETEVLVQEILDWAAGREGLEAVDVGTGSGAIALSLALEGPFVRVVATDASRDALEVAGHNAAEVGLEERVALRHGSLFEPLGGSERFDVVVSNPPYVAEGEAAEMEPEVTEWEPAAALFAGPDGLAVLRALVSGAGEHLKDGGLLALELGAGQAGPMVTAVEEARGWHDVRVRKDLARRERVLLARRATAAGAGVEDTTFENETRGYEE